ncbi:MAG: NosD domain-containing protein, partial [Thermoplasmatota archaeon]
RDWYDGSRGIRLYYCEGSIIRDNELRNCSIHIEGELLVEYTLHELSGNSVNGLPVKYLRNTTGGNVKGDWGDVIIANCSNVKIEDLSITNSTLGLQMAFSNNCSISNISIERMVTGMKILETQDVRISNSHLNDGEMGIFIQNSERNDILVTEIERFYDSIELRSVKWSNVRNNSIDQSMMGGDGITVGLYSEHNQICGNEVINCNITGIRTDDADNNLIFYNRVEGNRFGVILNSYSTFNTVSNNTIISNRELGLYIGGYDWLYLNQYNTIEFNNIFSNGGFGIDTKGRNNSIHHNNLIDNNRGRIQARDNGTANRWNTSSGLGNYWGDYRSRYPGAANNGKTWSIPYKTNGTAGASDHYPLVTIVDLILPTLIDLSTNESTTGDVFHFRARAYDNIGIKRVNVEYWYGSEPNGTTNLTMHFENDNWTTFIMHPQAVLDFSYFISVQDEGGNWVSSEVRTMKIRDNDRPACKAGGDITTQDGRLVTFNGSQCTDNIGIANYTWTFQDWGIKLYGVAPSFIFENPAPVIVELNVSDAAGLWDTDSLTVNVRDGSPPNVVLLTGELTVDHREPFTLVVEANDFNDVKEIKASFRDLSGEHHNNSMLQRENDTWEISIPAQEIGGIINITIWAVDELGNGRSHGPFQLTVIDNILPTIEMDYGEYIEKGKAATITATAQDISGIAEVLIEYTDTRGASSQDEMYYHQQRMVYIFDIPAQSQAGELHFRIKVRDGSGNLNETGEQTINVISEPVEVIVRPGENVTVKKGAVHQFDGTGTTGNGRIVNITWIFQYGGKVVTLYGPSPSFEFDAIGTYEITVTAVDSLGRTGIGKLIVTVTESGEEEIRLKIGPVKDREGNVIQGARVSVYIDGEEKTDLTDGEGYAYFQVRRENVGKNIEIKISLEGYDELRFSATILEDGTLSHPVPALDKEKEGGGGFPIWLMIIVFLALLSAGGVAAFIVISGNKKKREDKEDIIDSGSEPITEIILQTETAPPQPEEELVGEMSPPQTEDGPNAEYASESAMEETQNLPLEEGDLFIQTGVSSEPPVEDAPLSSV